MKVKFTLDQQIEHMKNKNISFNLYSEVETKKFLTNNNYYFKVKAFAKNYRKTNNKYIALDFRYLCQSELFETAKGTALLVKRFGRNGDKRIP